MDRDERQAERDERREAKNARKYGYQQPPSFNWGAMPPQPPRGYPNKDDQDDLPIDLRPDTRIEPGMSEAEINSRIRRRVAIRSKQRTEFLSHAVSFVAVNIMLWVIWGVTSANGGGFPWPIFVTLGWGIGLFAHGAKVYQNSAAVSARRESIVQREVEMEKARLGLSGIDYEKPKRVYRDSLQDDPGAANSAEAASSSPAAQPSRPSQQVRLSDDGELVPVDPEYDSDDNQRGRQSGQVY